MLEYGETFLEENRETLKRLEESMTPEALRAAKAMLAEFTALEDADSEEAQAA